MTKRERNGENEETKLLLESVAGAVGGILAIGTIAILLWDGVTNRHRPPIVVVEARNMHAVESGFVLEIVAMNRGDEPASQVRVEGTLGAAGEIVETSETVFDYVPGGSRRTGGLFFAADPSGHEVELRAKGYVDP
jgi:uncharacterized protein (TIGR02588 family)